MTTKTMHFSEKTNNSNMTKVEKERTIQSGWSLEIELGSEMSAMIYNSWKKKSDFIFGKIL